MLGAHAVLLQVATAHVLRASHSAPSLRAPNASLAQTRAKGATRYVLAHYSNQSPQGGTLRQGTMRIR